MRRLRERCGDRRSSCADLIADKERLSAKRGCRLVAPSVGRSMSASGGLTTIADPIGHLGRRFTSMSAFSASRHTWPTLHPSSGHQRSSETRKHAHLRCQGGSRRAGTPSWVSSWTHFGRSLSTPSRASDLGKCLLTWRSAPLPDSAALFRAIRRNQSSDLGNGYG